MRLMISVVSAAEARKAIGSGATLLDIKNPLEGSLGAQNPKIIREIREIASGTIELSAAIGDMPNIPGTAALASLGAAISGANYVKAGLFGPRDRSQALTMMAAVRDAVEGYRVSVIAAAYADHRRIDALDPFSILDAAEEAGIQGLLLDTAIKDGNTLLDYLDRDALREIAVEAHSANLIIAAAGSLKQEHLPILADAGIDIAGVRTAICRNYQRNGPLDPTLVRNLVVQYGEAVFV